MFKSDVAKTSVAIILLIAIGVALVYFQTDFVLRRDTGPTTTPPAYTPSTFPGWQEPPPRPRQSPRPTQTVDERFGFQPSNAALKAEIDALRRDLGCDRFTGC